MTLPTSRDITLAPSSPLPCALVNRLQDCVVGNKHGTITVSLPIGPLSAIVAGLNAQDASFNGSCVLPIEGIAAGKRITAVRAWVKDNATGPTKITPTFASVAAGTLPFVAIASGAISAGTGLLQTIAVNGLATIVTSGIKYGLELVISGGTAICHVYNVEVDYDSL